MIIAQELRIGNVFRGIGGIQTVLSLEENTDRGRCNYSSEEHRLMYSHLILCHQNGNQYKPFEIEPVILDEEVLLKCGFKKLCNEFSYKGTCFEKYKNEFFYSAGEGLKLSKDIEYLHQLQNLYFALTGTELDTTKLL